MRIADEFMHTSLSKLIFVMFRPKAYLRSCELILVVDVFTKRIYISGCIASTYTVGPVLPKIPANMHLNAKHSIQCKILIKRACAFASLPHCISSSERRLRWWQQQHEGNGIARWRKKREGYCFQFFYSTILCIHSEFVLS